MQGNNTCIQYFSESENKIFCSLDLSLIPLPMVEKMWVIEILKNNLQRSNKTFSFDDETQSYKDSHNFDFKEIIKNEDLDFVEFREKMFSEAFGSRFEKVGLLVKLVSNVYAQKRKFPSKKPIFNDKEMLDFMNYSLGLKNY